MIVQYYFYFVNWINHIKLFSRSTVQKVKSFKGQTTIAKFNGQHKLQKMASKMDDELLSTEFFGFHPGKLYKEIYAVGYNEFIEAIKALKKALQDEFPDNTDDINKSCDSFLTEYCETFDKKWFKVFADFCSKNLFKIPAHVPVYDPELNEKEANQDATMRVRQLKLNVLAMEYFNCRLLEKIKEVDGQIAEREQLKERIEQMKVKVEVIKKGRELEAELKSITNELLQNETHETET